MSLNGLYVNKNYSARACDPKKQLEECEFRSSLIPFKSVVEILVEGTRGNVEGEECPLTQELHSIVSEESCFTGRHPVCHRSSTWGFYV